ncbi:MAG: hypothetical protein ACFFD2_27225 [Promethearchaeota archaeon]
MKCNQKILLVTSIFVAFFYCLPIVMGGIPQPFSVAVDDYEFAELIEGGTIRPWKITYTANGTVDVFVTDDYIGDGDSYLTNGIIPDDVVASHTGSSGILCVPYNSDIGYYLIIGNYGGSSTVTGEYEIDFGNCGIGGFDIIIATCALIAIFGIIGILINRRGDGLTKNN